MSYLPFLAYDDVKSKGLELETSYPYTASVCFFLIIIFEK